MMSAKKKYHVDIQEQMRHLFDGVEKENFDNDNSYDDLMDEFNCLDNKYKELLGKFNHLTDKHNDLKYEKEELTNKFEDLRKENYELSAKLEEVHEENSVLKDEKISIMSAKQDEDDLHVDSPQNSDDFNKTLDDFRNIIECILELKTSHNDLLKRLSNQENNAESKAELSVEWREFYNKLNGLYDKADNISFE